MRLLIIIPFVFVAFETAEGTQVAPIAGIYSDLKYNDHGGDLLGTEIRITKLHGHYKAFVQEAEGEPSGVFTAPVDVVGNEISFTVYEANGERDRYVGRITAETFEGTWTVLLPTQSVRHTFRLLRRRNSYWKNSN
jgi:hypothetical protein